MGARFHANALIPARHGVASSERTPCPAATRWRQGLSARPPSPRRGPTDVGPRLAPWAADDPVGRAARPPYTIRQARDHSQRAAAHRAALPTRPAPQSLTKGAHSRVQHTAHTGGASAAHTDAHANPTRTRAQHACAARQRIATHRGSARRGGRLEFAAQHFTPTGLRPPPLMVPPPRTPILGFAPSPCAVSPAMCRRFRGTQSCVVRASGGGGQSLWSDTGVVLSLVSEGGLKVRIFYFYTLMGHKKEAARPVYGLCCCRAGRAVGLSALLSGHCVLSGCQAAVRLSR